MGEQFDGKVAFEIERSFDSVGRPDILASQADYPVARQRFDRYSQSLYPGEDLAAPGLSEGCGGKQGAIGLPQGSASLRVYSADRHQSICQNLVF